ncbi:hypothetical protein H4219_002239 [Mycoemilia scoparia]|uniref:Fanconi anemia group D2 protein n=1 Tax=Mycoemilia scoparia TaxID=417184 RepID=A0A9W7ZY57_9FUNG|nr:hypothetical protein H4219_002239 [Mycoemilia scoparia]
MDASRGGPSPSSYGQPPQPPPPPQYQYQQAPPPYSNYGQPPPGQYPQYSQGPPPPQYYQQPPPPVPQYSQQPPPPQVIYTQAPPQNTKASSKGKGMLMGLGGLAGGLALGGLLGHEITEHNEEERQEAYDEGRMEGYGDGYGDGYDDGADDCDNSFVEGVSEFLDNILSDRDQIIYALRPICVKKDDGEMENTSNSDNLVRLLLSIDKLQVAVINAVLEKVVEFIGDEADECDSLENNTDLSLSMRLIRQLRWLDYVVDPKQLTDKIIEILTILPLDIQKDIIVALPDIISDDEHQKVASILVNMMRDEPEHLIPILDALSGLECPINILNQCRNTVVKSLNSARISDLPVMLKFLFQSTNAENASSMITRIRKYLNMQTINSVGHGDSSTKDDKKIPEIIIMETVAFSLQSQKFLRDIWMRQISDEEEIGNHSILDIFVLLFLHTINSCRKKVEALFKSKISSSDGCTCYTSSMLKDAMKNHPAIVNAYFQQIVSLGSYIYHNFPSSSQATNVTHSMLTSTFVVMGDYQRQEVVGALVTHIGSGRPFEIKASMRTLYDLASNQSTNLRPFTVFVKGLLDYIDELPLESIRSLFDILGLLSYFNGLDGDGLFNELHIFVRKQLTSTNSRYNTIGVVGAISLLKQLGAKNPKSTTEDTSVLAMSSTQSSQIPQNVNIRALKDAVLLLEMIIDAGRHQSWSFLAMAYDELAHLVETDGLHSQLEIWLHENVASSFAELYLSDTGEVSKRYEHRLSSPLPVSFNMDGNDSDVVLDLFVQLDSSNEGATSKAASVLASSNSKNPSLTSIRVLGGRPVSCLFPLFRLVQVCERATNGGSLDEIDAILGCGLVLFPQKCQHELSPSLVGLSDNEEEMCDSEYAFTWDGNLIPDAIMETKRWPEPSRRFVCAELFLACNWFIEIINAFAYDPKDDGVINRIIGRMNQLSVISTWLSELSTTISDFDPVNMGLTFDTHGGGKNNSNRTNRQTQSSLVITAPLQTDAAFENQLKDRKGKGKEVDISFDSENFPLSQMDILRNNNDDESNSEINSDDGKKQKPNKRRSDTFKAAGKKDQKSGQTKPLWSMVLREFEPTVFKILQWADLSPEISSNVCVADKNIISIRSLNFLMTRIIEIASAKLIPSDKKLGSLPGASASKSQTNGFGKKQNYDPLVSGTSGSTISSILPQDLFDAIVPLIPQTLVHLQKSLEFAQSTLDSNEDCNMFEEFSQSTFSLLKIMLDWDGLDSVGNGERLKKAILVPLVQQGGKTSNSELNNLPVSVLINRTFDYLVQLTNMTDNIQCVLKINQILHILAKWGSAAETSEQRASMTSAELENTMFHKLGDIGTLLITGKWSGYEDLKSTDIEAIVAQQIVHAIIPIEIIQTYSTKIFPSFLEGRLEELGDEYALLGKPTLVAFYRAVSKALVGQISKFEESNFDPVHLQLIKNWIWSWYALVQLLKGRDDLRQLLLVCLRCGQQWIEKFMKQVIPYLDTYFGAYQEEIMILFGKLQKATRMLQVICGHGKVTKDIGLMALVPSVRRALESFLFKVKALFAHHNVSSAFSLANLKHRNLAGEVVSSQMPAESRRSDSEDAEESQDEEAVDDNEAQQEMDEVSQSSKSRRKSKKRKPQQESSLPSPVKMAHLKSHRKELNNARKEYIKMMQSARQRREANSKSRVIEDEDDAEEESAEIEDTNLEGDEEE